MEISNSGSLAVEKEIIKGEQIYGVSIRRERE